MNNKNFLSSDGVLKRLTAYAKPYWKQFILVFFLIIIITVGSLAQPRLVQILIDQNLSPLFNGERQMEINEFLSQVLPIGLLYLATVGAVFFATYAQIWILNKTGQRILLKIRQQLYDHVLQLPMSYFDTHPLGNLVTRVTNDTENLNEMFTSVLTSLFRNGVQILGIIVIMLSMNLKMGLMVLGLSPIIIAVSIVFRKVIRKVYDQQRKILSKINNHLAENISGMSVIQMFHQEDRVYDEFDEADRAYLKESKKEVKYFATYRPAVELVRSIGIALLLWFGGRGYLQEAVTFGVLYAFIEYIQRFFQPILGLAETYNIVQSAMTSSKRIFDLFDEGNPIGNHEEPIVVERLEGEIQFENVWFAYKKEEWVLKDVSFHIQPGEFYAFVGATGAGKSSIMNLISRFYDIQHGRITIDGIDIKKYDIQSLRRAVGVVQQDVFLFSGTIEDNISMNRADITREQIEKAAHLVNADNFIGRLPNRYDQTVTERGSTLSAGQRQLLSYARTMASNPSVLILDEATANIDTETELLIQDAISKMSEKRTMIAVAHRISTIADADRIIVMHEGKIAEQGTKDELLEKDGIFRVLYELQFKN